MFSSNTSQVSASGPAQAEAIDFDGTNDTLSRTSDLVGNADGKTFTFSAWVWLDTTGSCQILTAGFVPINFFVSSNIFSIYLDSTSGGTRSITMDTNAAQIPTNTFVHILYSADVSNTSLRRLYINDVFVSGVTYTDYNNININWTQSDWSVGGATQRWDGRLSNVFLDYTYRDLSVTANRRLFVTADLKPAADQAALNPILYLPMSDPTQPGLNTGTGGNFTLTGTVARSGRGPNQYNAPYSVFDGSADYLSRTTALTGIADGKQFTISGNFKKSNTSTGVLFEIADSTPNRFVIYVTSTPELIIEGYNASGTRILFAGVSSTYISINRTYAFTLSVDMADTSKRHLSLNGEIVPVSWYTYTNDVLDINPTTPVTSVGRRANGSNFWSGNIGSLWFNTSYIDLSVPANLAKFVSGTGINAAPVDLGANGELPTGTSPLIYLPMYGNNAGRNYGTGGNFTVNSGPYPGARGPNEFWGNRADFNGTTGYLSRTSALTGVSDGKVVSFSAFVTFDDTNTTRFLLQLYSAAQSYFRIFRDNVGRIVITGWDASNTLILNASSGAGILPAGSYWISVAFDLSNSSLRYVYKDSSPVSITWNTYTNANIKLSASDIFIGSQLGPANYLDGKLSELYFTTSYIDFNQEAERLKFRDAFGNPVNLTQQIEAAAIPTPAIYMRFPPTAFGTNSGTGGDFTVNGTITDGGQL